MAIQRVSAVTQADQAFFRQPRSTSVANFWGFTQGKKTDDDLKEAMGNWVDVSGPVAGSKSAEKVAKVRVKLTTSYPSFASPQVRNVAEAHVLALTKPEAGGNRFIVSAGPLNGQDIGELLVFHSQRV
jgi:hypothetical protein